MIEKHKSRKARAALRKALVEHWDPIGVNGIPEAADEYDGYIGGVFELLEGHATDEEIARHLRRIEVERMELFQLGETRLTSVARELRSVFEANMNASDEPENG